MTKSIYNEVLQKVDKRFILYPISFTIGNGKCPSRHSPIILDKDLQEIYICDFYAFKLMQGMD